jgi:hypothetical protein
MPKHRTKPQETGWPAIGTQVNLPNSTKTFLRAKTITMTPAGVVAELDCVYAHQTHKLLIARTPQNNAILFPYPDLNEAYLN